MPGAAELPERLDAVLHVIYLVFNEGYSASSGDVADARTICPARRSGSAGCCVELLPEPEANGLLALMLLHESRRAARTSPSGELVLLDDQDRSLLGPRARSRRARRWSSARSRSRRFGPYTLQAAIAAVHAEAPTRGGDRLGADRRALRRAAARRAVAGGRAEPRRGGGDARRPAAGLALIDAILARGELADYHLAHAARADLCRRLGRDDEARASYGARWRWRGGARAPLPRAPAAGARG